MLAWDSGSSACTVECLYLSGRLEQVRSRTIQFAENFFACDVLSSTSKGTDGKIVVDVFIRCQTVDFSEIYKKSQFAIVFLEKSVKISDLKRKLQRLSRWCLIRNPIISGENYLTCCRTDFITVCLLVRSVGQEPCRPICRYAMVCLRAI